MSSLLNQQDLCAGEKTLRDTSKETQELHNRFEKNTIREIRK